MKKLSTPTEFIDFPAAGGADWSTRFLRERLFDTLRGLTRGRITFVEGGERHEFGAVSADYPLHATIRVHNPRLYGRLALEGSIGAGESYAEGDWSSDDLTAVIRIFVLNRETLNSLDSGWLKGLVLAAFRILHARNRNTREGSRRNIAAHYDLGNDFFELFLDETMTYSAGIFASEKTTMRDASIAKYDRLCRKLALKPGERILEIGTGWGGFAIHAAKNYGVHVTTTTISRNQHDFARRKIAEAGLTDQIDLRFEDYRNLTGTFDKIVSIEMIEAVGWQYYETYFRQCAGLLKENGSLAIQAITIRDQYYERARRSVDFIQRHIFPGCTIPSMTALMSAATNASDLVLFHLEDNTDNYARTLAEWRREMFNNHELIVARGYPEHLLRLWEFYLCYCEGGFAERSIASVQFIMTKPFSRQPAILPELG